MHYVSILSMGVFSKLLRKVRRLSDNYPGPVGSGKTTWQWWENKTVQKKSMEDHGTSNQRRKESKHTQTMKIMKAR